MELTVAQADITTMEGDCVVIDVCQDRLESPLPGVAGDIDRALDGHISLLIVDGEIRGRRGEITVVHTLGRMTPRRILVLGCGKSGEVDANVIRRLGAEMARYARSHRYKRIVAQRPADGLLDAVGSAKAFAEGILLGLYRVNVHGPQSDADDRNDIDEVTIVDADAGVLPDMQRGLHRGMILAEATALARDLANEPANYMTPAILAERARSAAESVGLAYTNLTVDEMREMGMGGLLGVAAGSHQPPAFIILEHRGDSDETRPTIALIGKGVTFDSGGISIKPAANMSAMKGDMAGGAAIIGALQAIARLGLPIKVTGLIPATENLPGGGATKPGDVLVAMNGKTMEVENTDAEGRLILADALSYANSKGMSPLVDVATLTGAIRTALGVYAMGLFANDDEVAGQLEEASQKTGERMWRMPLWDEYKDQIKSTVANVKNTGGPAAGSITAAKFLQEFAGDTPWAHLDIASVSSTDSDRGWQTRGATGQPVRTLVQLIEDLAQSGE